LPSCDESAGRRRISGVKRCLGVIAVTLALTACAGSHSAAQVSPAFAVRANASATQLVDTHGIQVAVPAAWRLGRGNCGTPQENTVMWNEDGINLCLVSQPQGLSVVEFWGVLHRPHAHAWYQRHTTPVVIDGAGARRWDAGTVSGNHEVELIFPHRHITVEVLSPDPSLLQQILASVHVVRVDHNGCPTRPAAVWQKGSKPGGSRPFVPVRPRRVIGCSYQGRWLDHSNLAGPRAARHLARALDVAPYGFSNAPGHILPSACGSTWRGSSIVADFEYVRRPSVSVSAHLIGCTRLGASNGRWGVRPRPWWVGLITADARYAGALIDPHTLK
jgi:hypothetical protein